MTLAVTLLILAGALAYILLPLFQNQAPPATPTDRPALNAFAEATSRRDACYEALADLEFDFAAGKISQDDFARLKHQYQAAAVVALKDIDAMEAATPR